MIETMYQVRRKIKGFTLIEMVLSVAMFSLILAMTLPFLRTFSIRNDLDISVTALVQNLRRAQTLSQVADGDMSWGVHVSVGSILIYKGATYATRDQAFDETTAISPSTSVSGLVDIVFAKSTGMPLSTGTTTFTSTSNEIRNVTINEKGMVDF